MKEKIKSAWTKIVASVKSAPAVFGYGVVVGLVIGWVL